MKSLTVIADWADDTLNQQEFRSAMRGLLPSDVYAGVHFAYPQFFNIYHTAFMLDQIALSEERLGKPTEHVIFVNTDPRNAKTAAQSVARGADFLVIKLKSGLTVCGPNKSFCFSLIKPRIKKAYAYQGVEEGSQFRSRDLFPKVIALLMKNTEKELEKQYRKVNLSEIPDMKTKFVGHVDSFGNLKTTWKESDWKHIPYETRIVITLHEYRKEAIYSAHLTNHEPGQLAFYAGSSGEQGNHYMELATLFTLPYISANILFGKPHPGAEVKIEVKK